MKTELIATMRVAETYIARALSPGETKEGNPNHYFTQPVDSLTTTIEGIVRDRHHGMRMQTGARLKHQHPPGSTIRNNRQWSAISPTDISDIDDALELEGSLRGNQLGMNFVFDGAIGSLTAMAARGDYIVIAQPQVEELDLTREDLIWLCVHSRIQPCRHQGLALATHYTQPRLESAFPKASMNRRGITGWVEKGGIIYPDAKAWLLRGGGLE